MDKIKPTKNGIRRRVCSQKSDAPHTNFFIYLFLQLSLFFLDPPEALPILQGATRTTHLGSYQCIWDNFTIFGQNYYSYTNLSTWFVYTIHTCVSEIRLFLKSGFHLLWYHLIRGNSHLYKKSSFISLHSLLLLVNNTREVIEWNLESVTQFNGMKNAIMQVIYFLNGSVVNMLFYCHVITYWEKVLP